MKQIFILLLLLSSTQVLAQKGLSGSPQQSTYTYIYRIPDQELLAVYKSKKQRGFSDNFMTQPVDSFITTDNKDNPLPPGNYLLVTANHQTLQRAVRVVHNIFINVLNNNKDFILTLHTPDGKQVNEAEVRMGKRTIPYNKELHAFYRKKYNGNGGLVQVKYQNITNFFRVYPDKRELQNNDNSTSNDQGYLSFSKPKYKPNDTVKLKSFLLDEHLQPLTETLQVRLSAYDGKTDTILAILHPYRPGGYEYQFVMKDSMTLDETYTIALEPINNEPKYRRTSYISNNFYFEEYELQKIKLNASVNKTSTQRHEPVILTLSATDENGLPILDGRLKIIVTPITTPEKYNADHLFLPDTMYNQTIPVEAVGKTIVQLPDSIFPAARFNYIIDCQLLNAENETLSSSLQQVYSDELKKLDVQQKNDSLYINMMVAGKSVPDTATIYEYDEYSTLLGSSHIQIPATIKIQPHIVSYNVTSDTLQQEQKVTLTEDIKCESKRTPDSIYFKVNNPHNIPFWYTIYGNKKIKGRGYGQSLNWQHTSSSKTDYYLQVQYMNGNQIITSQFDEKYQRKKLNVEIKAPATITPGQESNIEIAVSDQQGKPVANADITAYSYTAKFQNAPEIVPYLGKDRPNPNFKNQYYHQEPNPETQNMGLNFAYWSSRMRLDTILWYQFTHPSPVFRYDEAAADSITQIAPFVMEDGYLRNAAIIYIDRLPVYFTGSSQLVYSFRTTPGKHTIEIRTADRLVTIDSFMVHPNVKNFVSINPLQPGQNITVEKQDFVYSSAEADRVNHYFYKVGHNYADKAGYVKQDKNIYFLSPGYSGTKSTVGPLTGKAASLVIPDQFIQSFDPEEGYEFLIAPGLIKQKQTGAVVQTDAYINARKTDDALDDQVLTPDMIKDYFNVPSHPRLITDGDNNDKSYTGKLEFDIPDDTNNIRFYTLLFRDDETSFIRVFNYNTTLIKGLREGRYRIMFLYNNNRFSMQDSIYIKKDGINYYSLRMQQLLPTTEISAQDSLLIKNHIGFGFEKLRRNINPVRPNVTYPTRLYPTSSFSIRGIVKDKSGIPLPGASVFWKGTNKGTVTDMNGEFKLTGTTGGILKVSYIGYESLEIKAVPKKRYYEFILKEASNSLMDVVVVGYGASRERDKRKRKTADQEDEHTEDISSKLYGSRAPDNKVLANPGLFNPDNINNGDQEMLNAAISVESTEAPNPFRLRSHFNDAAFWQPRLATDARGTASFSTVFPDDITNWRVFALVMNDHQQSGQAETSIRSFMPVSANLALPNFAIEGDSINVIGKALNYTSDTLQISRTFAVNDTTHLQRSGALVHSIIDTLAITIPVRDSMRFKYTIDNRDGEQRSIPVFRAGTSADTGFFASLLKDSSLTFAPGLKGPVHVHAEVAILPVLIKEMEYVQNYKYLCNEQLASKLKAYLLEKKAKAYLNQKFEHNKDINTIINRLKKTKHQGMWGWWENTSPSLWISIHVIEALRMAEEAGYTTNINNEILADDLLSMYHSKNNVDSIGCLMLLSQLKAKVDFATMTSEIVARNGYDSLRLLLIKQRENLPVNLKPILARKQATMFGNAYWGEYSYALFQSSISQTLLVYKLLRATGGYDEMLQKIRGYFLEERKNGQWRNTYESSEILETILPDLLKAEGQGKASLQVNGHTITKFPFDSTITAGNSVAFTKKGGMPVYLTGTQTYWDASPDPVSKSFEVSSRLDQPVLETGKKVTLTVTVNAKADADYVMIEIPVPAGCSYASKPQQWYNNEVHREYEKEMVSIFCSTLYWGQHTFTIELMPRYTGKYILNPAKATMQYFPLFMGRTGIKKVTIQ
ncbi:carboxypeptidase-like regulatory domain-containing protein [Chitinophaga sancti]|uniref:carboxypeptidase-like regulatory domain-containing protein n=1 Tax=Chitinophaga sancti TaxID=1004 RepID=UPI003F78CC67